MSLLDLRGYFTLLFVGVMTWSKLRQRRAKSGKDAERPILRKIEEVEHAKAAHHVMAGRG